MLRRLNSRGLTLIEVLASAAILAFVVLLFSLLFTQGYRNSKTEENRDQSVAIARGVMELIKTNLPSPTASVSFNGTPINLTAIRNANAATATAASFNTQYPGSTDGTYAIVVTADPVPESVTVESKVFPLNQYFRKVKVHVTETMFQSEYTLESYLEYNKVNKE
ncbi:type IV pilus modification PilV family protein [Paenibacillus mesotrionivorans]|uniref:Prepilin-type N-terminal cleavage/methylation domain-containing protein n=1 Tax=Paenibacillus mesotrionivorans TaxID=3160968 RepID=A0ACC7NRX9_9BACL